MSKIALDIGHGGDEPGAVSPHWGLKEKDINLAVGKKLAAFLRRAGHEVVMTRESDEGMQPGERLSRMPNDADISVSIHHNAFPKEEAHGAEVYYWHDSDESRELAELILANLTISCGLRERGVKPSERFYILRETPGRARVLVENGFITNKLEGYMMTTDSFAEREALAVAFAVGLYSRLR